MKKIMALGSFCNRSLGIGLLLLSSMIQAVYQQNGMQKISDHIYVDDATKTDTNPVGSLFQGQRQDDSDQCVMLSQYLLYVVKGTSHGNEEYIAQLQDDLIALKKRDKPRFESLFNERCSLKKRKIIFAALEKVMQKKEEKIIEQNRDIKNQNKISNFFYSATILSGIALLISVGVNIYGYQKYKGLNRLLHSTI